MYKRTHGAMMLHYVDAEESNQLINEMHAGLMGAHANGPFLAKKMMRAGYYWLTMESDCIKHIQACHKCQISQECTTIVSAYLGGAIAFLCMGNGYDRSHHPESLKQT